MPTAMTTWANNATSATNTSGTTWGYWCDGTASSTAATSVVWVRWTSGSGAAASAWAYAPALAAREQTPEERAAREAEAERRRVAAAEAEAKRRREKEEADLRAERLLTTHLDAEQRKDYAKDKSFRVKCGDGNTYRVRQGWAGHVDRLDDVGRPVERFCIHPRTTVPLPDNQLVAKLLLETDPEYFRRVANATPIHAAPA